MDSSPSFGGQCPSCQKRFANDSCVLRHMNHPATSCMSSFDFLESILRPTRQTPTTDHQNSETNYEIGDETANSNETTNVSGADCYEDVHPNVPIILESGAGFMDDFNADRHAEKRRENLYFPFSSKAEWGLASWLLCSGLSMRAINDFLALPIVSSQICLISSVPNQRSGPTAFSLVCDCENSARPHGRSPRGAGMENADHLPQRIPDSKTPRPVSLRSTGMCPVTPPSPDL